MDMIQRCDFLQCASANGPGNNLILCPSLQGYIKPFYLSHFMVLNRRPPYMWLLCIITYGNLFFFGHNSTCLFTYVLKIKRKLGYK
jgi:hypothetical protein